MPSVKARHICLFAGVIATSLSLGLLAYSGVPFANAQGAAETKAHAKAKALDEKPPVGRPIQGGEFKVCLNVHPSTLNPILAEDNYSLQPLHWMVETLLSRDPDTYDWVPALAENYHVSKDGRTYTFNLRHGVHFHNGTEMTAEDVAFSIKVHASPQYDATAENQDLKVFDQVKILDKYRIEFHAKEALFVNLSVLASQLVVPASVYGNPKDKAKQSQIVIGTGPYRLKDYHLESHLELEANPDWWGRALARNSGRFNFSRIFIRFVEDESLRLAMLEKGDLDFCQLSQDAALKRTREAPWGHKVFLESDSPLGFLTTQKSLFINLRRPIFAGLRTRRALQMMLNRDLLNEKFWGGQGLEATGPWHRLSEYADPSMKPIAYDEKRAANLLKEDGWTDHDGDGILDKIIDGKKVDFRFTLMYPRRDEEKILSIFQGDLKKVGVELGLRQVDWTLFMKNLADLNFDGFVVGRGWPGVIDFSPRDEWNSHFTGKGQGNAIGYGNPIVDQLMDKADHELNRSRRRQLLQNVYRRIAEDQSQILLFCDRQIYYARSRHLKTGGLHHKYLFDIDNWWINDSQ